MPSARGRSNTRVMQTNLVLSAVPSASTASVTAGNPPNAGWIPGWENVTRASYFLPSTYNSSTMRFAVSNDYGEATVPPLVTAITSSTNATPIEITTTTNHLLQTGDVVTIVGHTTNTKANGTWVVTRTANTTFTLTGSVGNGVGGATGNIIGPAMKPTVNLISGTTLATFVQQTAVASKAYPFPQDAFKFRNLRVSNLLAAAGTDDLITVSMQDTRVEWRREEVQWAAEATPSTQAIATSGAVGGSYLIPDGIVSQTLTFLVSVDGGTFVAPLDAGGSAITQNLSFACTSISNATPQAVTATAAHGLQPGSTVTISGVTTDTVANNRWTVSLPAATWDTLFTLDDSTAGGVGGGTILCWARRWLPLPDQIMQFPYFKIVGAGTEIAVQNIRVDLKHVR